MTDRLILLDLVAAVQSRAIGDETWRTVAAFDLVVTAEAYAERAFAGTSKFEYCVVPLGDANQMTGAARIGAGLFRQPGNHTETSR